MVIARQIPGTVRQTLGDSCWAAVLESWSIVERRISRLRQDPLIEQWGEGAGGGISPVTKIPRIARAYGLAWGGFPIGELGAYIRRHLATSHIFCAYTRGQWCHTVLIYRLRPEGVSFMDPDGGHYRNRPLQWLEARGPFVAMRKP